MTSYVVPLEELGRAQVATAGGKGAHLGELARIDGVRVPPGFCVTTAAFERVMAATPAIHDRLERLAAAGPDAVPTLAGELRHIVSAVAVPDDLAAEITGPIVANAAYAVRSSATAEDSATASFAGQHDTYLNVVGEEAILDHVRRCWASLFAERAVTYRLRNGVDHRTVTMAVVVQRMIFPRAAGIMFTADPVTGNRRTTSIDAGFGLGEALVSGLVHADVYRVRDGAVTDRAIGTKKLAVVASPAGGTEHREIEPERQGLPVLTDAEIVRLERLGRHVEAHFGSPQDIEWCLDDEGFAIVQSRPITTLFPIPAAADGEWHVYVSVGHQQMMTEAMKPLGLSVWKATSPGHMTDAGGRLFVDVTARLGPDLIATLGRSDPLIGDALRTVTGLTTPAPAPQPAASSPAPQPAASSPAPQPAASSPAPEPIEADPGLVAELIAEREASLAALKSDISGKSGTALIDFVVADLGRIRDILFEPRNMQVIMAGMEAAGWLNDHLRDWLGEKSAADALAQSAPHNVTSEMGLALLDVADVLRPYPQVVAFLQDGGELGELPGLPGGRAARDAIEGYLTSYGMRCVGEIDITRPRWSEQPATLLPMILGAVRTAEPGERARRFEQGLREAHRKEQEILARLRDLPGDGAAKAAETKRMIDRLRTFAGYREYPKYHLVSRYLVYKTALLAEARRLTRSGVLRDPEDIYFLTLEELSEVVRTQRADAELLRDREEAFRAYETLTPPRVLTSDGEAVTGSYHRDDLPAGTLAGLPVSAGIVEGRARVVHDPAVADLEPGDILVTAYTDPSWTPAFVTVAGLVTEVGGLMTHGAVIAREYGLPAVVGVENATRLIRDGQRIRVHGTDGYVSPIS
ncbi:rifamycin-inactivating phosphotransferase [Paractinoplanes deccanensis]|uniref:rifamycin-inactivating phosphotransferase n=1 Tax=Paractinoplanes deccanensis TaxID=113561 RepID=UPI001940FF40|nr:rifamycin-inactivating phosphotransferase [Actinoplanes deccanensis]